MSSRGFNRFKGFKRFNKVGADECMLRLSICT